MRFKVLLYIFLLCTCSTTVRSEDMYFKNLTPGMGLSHGDVLCIFQDHEGYMWIGTADGLNKYDGVEFKVYKNNPKDTSSLPNNCVIGIYEDKRNNLWIGTATSGGLCKYNRDEDNFERVSCKDEHHNKIEFITTTLFEDKDNKLWVSTSNGVYWFDREKNVFHPCFTDTYGNDILVNFNEIHQDKNGILWFTSEDPVNGGIIKYNPVTKETDRFNTNHPVFKLKENRVYSLLIDKQDNIWFGGYSTGLSMINEHSKTIVNYQNEPNNSNSLTNNFITSIIQTQEGKILIGTNGGGLNVFDPVTKKFEHYLSSEAEGAIISSTVDDIYLGNDGSIWIGCWSGGVSIYDKRHIKFASYKHDEQSGYSFNVVTNFTEDLSENIWIGTDGKGITCFNPEENKFTRYLSDNNNPQTLTNDKVLAVQADDKGGLWVGMWQGGLNYFQINGNKLVLKKKYPYVDENDPKSNSVFRIYRNNAGEIWVGNFETGAYLFDPKTERFNLVFSLKDTIKEIKANSAVVDMLSDYQGDIWFGTLGNGLIRLNRKTGKYDHFNHIGNDSTSINSDGINVIFEDSEKRLWIGSSGLSLFNRQTNTFTNFTTAQGLPDNSINGILEDDHHNLWISSNNGISKATIVSDGEKLQFAFRNYSTTDGLQDNTFNKWAFFKSKNGKMYFGGINGFNVFFPDSIKDNPYRPPVHITEFLLFNKPVVIGTGNSPLKKDISQTKEIVLKHNQSVLTFRYIALNYIYSEKNQYAYKMEGFEQNWSYVGNKREATYTNLDPGKYTFRVKASNNDGIWNENGTSVIIVILPPWWQTWWFRLLVILTILISIFTYVNYRIHHLKKQKILLTGMVKERTIQLEEANTILEEKQEEIFRQNEELQAQKEALQEVNSVLEEKQQEILLQNEELLAQKENLQEINRKLEEQKEEIESQRNELDLHRDHLEHLVQERTDELATALKKAEESDRLKSAFLQNMSHEIRTPMNAIVGFAELLTDPDVPASEKESFTSLIKNSSETLLMLINDILDMSQIQANQLTIENQTVDVFEIMKDIFISYQLQAQTKGITLTLDDSTFDKILLCLTDPTRFKQILTNLISNALKFTDKGSVKFGATIQSPGFITFYVQDTGIGINPEVGNSIFERFLKIESTNNRLYGGVGLGLSICYSFVTAMGGKIWYESESKKGTTFYFTLPCGNINHTTEIKTKNDPKEYKIPDLTNKQILIVEDEEINYILLSFFLAKTKAKIIWAKDGFEAIENVKKNKNIDLILMDLKMPVMDGIEATKHIRQISPDQAIIAQTAYAYKEEKDGFLKSGFNGYIEKPFVMGKLLKIIHDVITMKDTS